MMHMQPCDSNVLRESGQLKDPPALETMVDGWHGPGQMTAGKMAFLKSSKDSSYW